MESKGGLCGIIEFGWSLNFVCRGEVNWNSKSCFDVAMVFARCHIYGRFLVPNTCIYLLRKVGMYKKDVQGSALSNSQKGSNIAPNRGQQDLSYSGHMSWRSHLSSPRAAVLFRCSFVSPLFTAVLVKGHRRHQSSLNLFRYTKASIQDLGEFTVTSGEVTIIQADQMLLYL